ncbi:DNA-binding protein, partial [Dysosmobacter welbionis]
CYLVFRRYLFGVFHVAVLVNLPGTCPVRLPHTGCDLVFILAAVHQYQGHAVGLAAGLIDHGKAVMGQHGAGALAWQHPVRIDGAELVNFVGLVAAVHQGQVDHGRVAVRQGKLHVHGLFHLCHGKRLPVGHVLAGHVVAP